MLRVTLKSPGNLVLDDAPEPVLKKGEALIDVKSVGICAFDIAPYLGKELDLTPLPMVTGHEFGGIVKEINGNTQKIKVGDKVAVYSLLSCGNCYYCKHGLELACENQRMFGSQDLPGAMVERIAIPIDMCIKLSEDFDIRYAGLIEPATVANHTVGKIKNSNMVIIGVGSIGMIMLEIAKTHNNKVIVIDTDEDHLALAKKLKADLALNFKDATKDEKIKSFLGEDKVDVVVLAFINQDTVNWAMDIVKKHGLIINMATQERLIKVDFITLQLKSINLRGSDAETMEEFEEAARMIEDGTIHAKELVSKIFPLAQAKEAFEYKAGGSPLKVILTN